MSAPTSTPTPTLAQVAAAAASKPAPVTAAKEIPGRARPTPIAAGRSPRTSSPATVPGASLGGTSFRRGGRSFGVDANGHSLADESNWRARGSEAGSVPKNGRGPERTVGGFEKQRGEQRSGARAIAITGSVGAGAGAGAAVTGASVGAGESLLSSSAKEKASALSHVPCRFFKAGACTAGSACQFSHDVGGKREVCQWFLKGDCKFGHKCALAHVRPGEPMSMDRRNKKDQQREARERVAGGDEFGTSPVASLGGARASPIPTPSLSHPVPIKSAISASLQAAGSLQSPTRFASSPLREPYGPPSAVVAGSSPSAGFNAPRPIASAGFASSPSRPSPLSTSYNARGGSIPSALSLKSGSVVAHSPLRPPSNPGTAIYSSSLSHSALSVDKSSGQLSASFAGGIRSIWTRSETPDEPLSPARRPPTALPSRVMDDVFDDNDDHGETLLPSSLSDLLTPNEMARRMSRTDSREGALPDSPRGAGFAHVGAERLAQSANAALPGNFLEALWSKDGGDARKEGGSGLGVAVGSGGQAKSPATADLSFSPGANAPSLRQSLLSQQRTPAPTSPGVSIRQNAQPAVDAPFLLRDRTDPSSPTARALQQHAPGQSLPGGIAAALSRMHMQPRASSGLAQEQPAQAVRREDHDTHDEEALFQMDNMDL